jgi:phosphohistidine phosphatase
MPTLYVLRHTKSSWDDPSLADSDRPLAPRGRKAARRIGAHMLATRIEPQLILCSTARRARETVEGLGDAVSGVELQLDDEFYGAGVAGLVERLQRVPYWVETALLVGHNPGLQELVVALSRPGLLRDRVARKLPTGALATLSLDGSWRTLRPGAAELTALVFPRELPE